MPGAGCRVSVHLWAVVVGFLNPAGWDLCENLIFRGTSHLKWAARTPDSSLTSHLPQTQSTENFMFKPTYTFAIFRTQIIEFPSRETYKSRSAKLDGTVQTNFARGRALPWTTCAIVAHVATIRKRIRSFIHLIAKGVGAFSLADARSDVQHYSRTKQMACNLSWSILNSSVKVG